MPLTALRLPTTLVMILICCSWLSVVTTSGPPLPECGPQREDVEMVSISEPAVNELAGKHLLIIPPDKPTVT